MPQLLSRMDDVGWLTPSVAEVLDDLPPLPYHEQFRREQALALQKGLNEAGVPGRIVRVGVFLSHTLFVVQPGGGRRRANVTAADIAEKLPILQTALGASALGLVPVMRRSSGYVGLLVRMPNNQPLRLRNLLLMPVFQAAPAATSLALGLDLDQQVVTRDLADLSNLLIVGDSDRAGRVLRSLLATLLLFNTPSEVRLALLNPTQQGGSDHLKSFVRMPHVLGGQVRDQAEGLRLLSGMVRECERRRVMLLQEGVADIAAYHEKFRGHPDKKLPHLIIVLEDVLAERWLADYEQWFERFRILQAAGSTVGIHLVLVAYTAEDRGVPALLDDSFHKKILVRPFAETRNLWAQPTPFPGKFVEGFLVEGARKVVPLMFGRVSVREVKQLEAYWQQIAVQRIADGKVGAADDLPPEDGPSLPGQQPVVSPPSTFALARATVALMPEELRWARARALAAYLGWLGVGPLRDVMVLSEEEAETVIEQLQAEGVLEEGSGPIWRFVRLDQPADSDLPH